MQQQEVLCSGSAALQGYRADEHEKEIILSAGEMLGYVHRSIEYEGQKNLNDRIRFPFLS